MTSEQEAAREAEVCPICGTPLKGRLLMIVIETDDELRVVTLETAGRNWLECQECRRVLCKSCTASLERSYCRPCRQSEGLRVLPNPAASLKDETNSNAPADIRQDTDQTSPDDTVLDADTVG